MKASINEQIYENNIIIPKLEKLGYKFINYMELLKIRGNNNEVLLFSEIKKFLNSKNHKNNHINEVILKLKNLKESDLINANKKFQDYINEGIKIRDNKMKKFITIKLFE